MKISWRYKMVLLMLVAVVGAIAVTWVLNRTFLEDYYFYNKINTLDSAYKTVNSVLLRAEQEAGSEMEIQFSEEAMLEMEILATRNNLSLLVMKDMQAVYFSNENDLGIIMDRLKPDLFPGQMAQFNSYRKIKTVDNLYEIFENYDKRTKSTFLELVWKDDVNGDYIFIRTNLESLQSNVSIANKFLAYAGGLVALLVSMLLFFATKSFVRPVEELSNIAKRMSNLDFNAKYKIRSKDEIGELGHSINLLSEKLEDTISDLKSANNQLQTDIEQKVQVDEMRKEFLSNVTHELKTPIALIQGYAEGLKDNITEDQESREFYCDVIIDEASKMNKMVKKLLTLNQLEFGNNVIEMERFDIVPLIRSVIESSEILAKQNEIRMQFDQKEPVEVWADEYMIEEVVTNYLTNAIHHAQNEKIIDVRITKQDSSVRISIFNSGAAIPDEEVDKIWIKFYKVDKARTREYGGSGIGLSIVKAIMESHNKPFGVINHNNGVEFWFELDADAEIQT